MARPTADCRARDVRRRVEVIRKKISDLRQLGVTCAFCYASVRNAGSFFTVGDRQITDVIEFHKGEVLRNLLDSGAPPTRETAEQIHLVLPPLPAPLGRLGRRALQTLLSGILKDLGVKWSDPRPQWWPPDVPYVPSCSVPDDFSGNWTAILQKVIEFVYSYFSYDITTYTVHAIQREEDEPAVMKGALPGQISPVKLVTGSRQGVTTTDATQNAYKQPHPSPPANPYLLTEGPGQKQTSEMMAQAPCDRNGIRGSVLPRNAHPIQYTKFTMVSASSLAGPRKRDVPEEVPVSSHTSLRPVACTHHKPSPQVVQHVVQPSTSFPRFRPLCVKDGGGALFGRLELGPPPVRTQRVVGAGHKTNKLHFHMMTVVSRAKQVALRKSTRVIVTPPMVKKPNDRVAEGRSKPEAEGRSKPEAEGHLSHASQPSNAPKTFGFNFGNDASEKAVQKCEGEGESERGRSSQRGVKRCVTGSNVENGQPRASQNKKVLTFHIYEDPKTAFKPKRTRQNA